MKLSPEDLKLVPMLVKNLRTNKSLTLNQIEYNFRFHGHKVSIARIKAMVSYIRSTEDIVIGLDLYFVMADNNQVWLSKDIQEIESYHKNLEKQLSILTSIKDVTAHFLKRIEAKKFNDKSQTELFNG